MKTARLFPFNTSLTTRSALYTTCSLSTRALLMHWLSMAEERLHPMSRQAFDVVARSYRGIYFMVAPLLRKLQGGHVGIGVMDMYAVIVSVRAFVCNCDLLTDPLPYFPGISTASTSPPNHVQSAEPAALQVVWDLVAARAGQRSEPTPHPLSRPCDSCFVSSHSWKRCHSARRRW